ncbi:hypothetical protein [Moorena sp. SIO4A5]|nr:hypothetical protein [Moorena sp. SIO4A5]
MPYLAATTAPIPSDKAYQQTPFHALQWSIDLLQKYYSDSLCVNFCPLFR